ncbi:MAG: hypothetical protein QME73_12755 [Bacillota bacterium]|nr:hypothetical protein [Bacillota bacterium]
MKRAVFCILAAVLIITAAASCTRKSDYEVFMEANEKTGKVEMGKLSMEISMNMDFNKEGLPEEAKKFLGLFEKFNLELNDEFNRKKEEGLKKVFLQTGEMGIDGKLYTRGKVGYVITPLIPKIVVVQGEELIHLNTGKFDKEDIPKLSDNSLEQLNRIWTALYSDENVSALEDIVMETPEGSVKAKKFVVKLTDEQLKPAIKKSMDVFMKDEQLINGMKNIMEGQSAEFHGFTVEEMLRQNISILDQATVNNFTQVAYIDRDNYVIDETVSMDITFHFTEPGMPNHYSFSMRIKRWDLNKEPKIYFPEVNEENSITLKQLSDEYPGVFDGMKGAEK